MLEKCPVYLSYKLKSFSLVEKLHEYRLKKTPNVMISALVLRNTSISSYKVLLEDFPVIIVIGKDYRYCKVCTERRKNMRMRACENIFLEIPCFRPVNLKKKNFSIASLSENNREFGFHITGYFLQRKSRIN